MEHHFDIEIAEKFGVDESIILNNFIFWITKNKANKRNIHEIEIDGQAQLRTWTYNSVKAFSDLFPYWTEKQIRRILTSMENQGLILTGNFNKVNYDKTKWYCLKDESLCPFGQIEKPKRSNRDPETVKPIPYNKPDNKPNKDPILNELKKYTVKLTGDLYKELYGMTYTPITSELKANTKFCQLVLKNENGNSKEFIKKYLTIMVDQYNRYEAGYKPAFNISNAIKRWLKVVPEMQESNRDKVSADAMAAHIAKIKQDDIDQKKAIEES